MLGKIEEIRGKQLEIQKKIEDENAKIDSLRKSIYFYVPSCLMVFTIFS
jgi:peptidoglycan hydrolase CwlO-like protein